jgi:hypothetical protein
MKTALRVASLIFALVVLFGSVSGYLNERSARRDAERRAAYEKVINDSTRARAALLRIERDSLAALYQAAKSLRGEVIAGVKIIVHRDTIEVPVSRARTDTLAGSRHAVLSDSTGGYRIEINAEAPEYPAPLRLGYRIETPEFAPEVGFIRHADGVDAVVSWAGKEFTVRNAYFRPEKADRFGIFVGAEARASSAGNVIGARIYGDAHLGVRFTANSNLAFRLKAGFAGSSYVGLSVETVLW